VSDGCTTPALVNPGAFDFVGDGFDEDCNGVADDGESACDAMLTSNSSTASDYAAALDLCAQTTDPAALPDRRYGLIDAALLLANGGPGPAADSHSIRTQFGGVTPQSGSAMVVLSTGNAAATGQTNPAFAPFESGTDTGTSSAAPSDWLSANGGSFPVPAGCPAAPNTTAHNPVMLRLRVRVPTNAHSFSVRANYLTADFPEWLCSPYDDLFVALLDSTAAGNPTDLNLAEYTTPQSVQYPVGSNLAYGDTGAFRQCINGIIGCQPNAVQSTITTCTGTSELTDTGFDAASTGCQSGDFAGGGTGWLEISGNVTPGEIVTLRLVIWDTGDGALDSLVLLDDLRWGRTAVTAGVTVP
jgi:hypothetical protein